MGEGGDLSRKTRTIRNFGTLPGNLFGVSRDSRAYRKSRSWYQCYRPTEIGGTRRTAHDEWWRDEAAEGNPDGTKRQRPHAVLLGLSPAAVNE
jgi:hypothetical protein